MLAPANSELKDILVISDLHKENIFTIIGRMESTLDYFQKHPEYHPLIPFLKVYLMITMAVAEKYAMEKNYFQDYKNIEQLDIYFASLYFDPLYTYLSTGEKNEPWKTYYSYLEKEKKIPLLELLLGINAHINADLASSLSHQKYSSEKDFFKINDILLETIPATMRMLLSEHDLIGIGEILFKNFIENEFHLIIERWRSEAWANYNLNKSKISLANNTEKLGKELIETITNLYHLKDPLALRHLNHLSIYPE